MNSLRYSAPTTNISFLKISGNQVPVPENSVQVNVEVVEVEQPSNPDRFPQFKHVNTFDRVARIGFSS